MQRNWHFRRRFVAVRGPTDVTAPTLSLPIDLPLSDTTAYLGVTTNEGAGTLYWVVTTSATPPSAAQVKAGQNDGGTAAAASGNQAVIATGAQVATATGLSSNTAYYAYFMQEDAVGNQSTVSAAGGFTTLTTGTSDTSFDDLIAAMSVAPTDLRKGYIAQMIQALYASGTWAKTDVLWVQAAHDEQAGRLNWKSPGTFTLTTVNSPTFTTDRGFAGNNSSSYLQTGWDPGTNGVQITRDNAHIMSYGSGGGNTIPGFSIDASSGNNLAVQNRRTANQDFAKVNSSTAVTIVAAGSGGATQMVMGRRSVSTDSETWRDGTLQAGPSAAASSALSTTDMVFGKNAASYTSARVGAASVGAYLDNTEALAFYNAFYTYMVAVGADT